MTLNYCKHLLIYEVSTNFLLTTLLTNKSSVTLYLAVAKREIQVFFVQFFQFIKRKAFTLMTTNKKNPHTIS